MTLDKTVLELANTLGIALTDIHSIYAEAVQHYAYPEYFAIKEMLSIVSR